VEVLEKGEEAQRSHPFMIRSSWKKSRVNSHANAVGQLLEHIEGELCVEARDLGVWKNKYTFLISSPTHPKLTGHKRRFSAVLEAQRHSPC
jgi:hypothetical protein